MKGYLAPHGCRADEFHESNPVDPECDPLYERERKNIPRSHPLSHDFFHDSVSRFHRRQCSLAVWGVEKGVGHERGAATQGGRIELWITPTLRTFCDARYSAYLPVPLLTMNTV